MNGDGYGYKGSEIMNRLRCNSETGLFNTWEGNSWCHNYFQLIPKEKYQAEHPDWYSLDGYQLCLTRDPEGLKAEVIQVMKEKLLAQPDRNFIAFSHNDGANWCQCPSCTAEYGLYDSQSTANFAVVIRFVNDVAKEIKAWNREICPSRDIKIFIYNYGPINTAPVKLDSDKNPVLDADGNYQPYSEGLMLEDNVGIVYCFGSTSYYSPKHEININNLAQFKRLQAVMKKQTFYFWSYSTYFQDYLLPINSLDSRPDYYQFGYESGAIAYLDMAQYNVANSTDFGRLKTYVSAKLLWDCQLDLDTLINDFMDNYFKEAAGAMKAMYADYRAYSAYLAEEKNVIGYVNGASTDRSEKNWPYRRVLKFLDYIDQAYAAIEPIRQTDSAMYEKLYNRILMESIPYRYLIIKLYPNVYSFTTLAGKKKEMLADCLKLGLSNNNEHGSIFEEFQS
jgi:hypothetical protein